MVPCSSSTLSSNRTFGPNFRTNAAWMPSRSSSSRSERSSCLVVVSSRNAANISVEPAIVVLLLGALWIGAVSSSVRRLLRSPLPHRRPIHYQVGLADLVQRQRDLGPVLAADRHVLVIGHGGDCHHPSPAECVGPNPGPLSDEAPPVLDPAQRPFEAGRRHLEHVAGADQSPGFQESLEGPA